MKDITLIFPQSSFLINDAVMPPLGILYLAAQLKADGYSVQCLDFGLGHTIDEVDSDIVGISFTTPHRFDAFKLAKQLKERGKTLIAGGAHASHLPNECLENGFDIAVRGEAEGIISEIVRNVQRKSFNSTYISAEKGVNELLFPDREAIDIKKYSYKIRNRLATVIMTSRSCPYHCLKGDTIVHTIEGDIPIQELTKYKTIKVLTRDPNTFDLIYADAFNIRKTRKNTSLVRVHFTDGTHIDCTPDHKFMAFKNGSRYSDTQEQETEAIDLKEGQSVRAVRFEYNKHLGRMGVSNKRKKVIPRSRLVMESVLGRPLTSEEHVHHKDRNKLNDTPINLMLTNKNDHIPNLHPEISERMKTNNPSFGKPHEYFVELGKKQKGKVRSLESRLRYRESKLGNKNPMYKETAMHQHKETRIKELQPNHKVSYVEHLPDKDDVYCMEVPGYDWFYANKVLVHNCSFCSKISNNFRMQSASRTIAEIFHLHDKYGFSAFMIFDDIFVADKRRLEKIVDLVKYENYLFRCFGRANLLTKEVCSLLKTMGTVEVGIGVESGSTHILKQNMKGTTKEINTQAVRNLQQFGIRAKAFLIVGLPGESEETVKETKQWIETARPDDLDVSILQPMPGSVLFREPEKYGINFTYDSNPLWYKGKPSEYKSSFSTKDLSAERIVELRDEIESLYKDKTLLR